MRTFELVAGTYRESIDTDIRARRVHTWKSPEGHLHAPTCARMSIGSR